MWKEKLRSWHRMAVAKGDVGSADSSTSSQRQVMVAGSMARGATEGMDGGGSRLDMVGRVGGGARAGAELEGDSDIAATL
jgi:hypothetical protein